MKKVSYGKLSIKTKRLEIRPYRYSDFKSVKLSHDFRLKKQNRFDEELPIAKIRRPDLYKKKVDYTRKVARMNVQYYLGIFDKVTGDFIGQIDFFVFNPQLEWVNLGYHIQNQYFGQGYATEAALGALKLAFKQLKFHRVESSAETHHKKSLNVLKNLGLNYEGVRKDFFPGNRKINLSVYAISRRDFRQP